MAELVDIVDLVVMQDQVQPAAIMEAQELVEEVAEEEVVVVKNTHLAVVICITGMVAEAVVLAF